MKKNLFKHHSYVIFIFDKMLKVMKTCIAQYGSVVYDFISSSYNQIINDLGEFMVDIPIFVVPWG
jgi:hypothetical protein